MGINRDLIVGLLGTKVLKDVIICPICKELFEDIVTIPCLHRESSTKDFRHFWQQFLTANFEEL